MEKRFVDVNELMKLIPSEEMVSKLAVANAPTIDAIEVVRCKDCKYYDDECPYPVCNYHEDNVKETDFCSRGERREDEAD